MGVVRYNDNNSVQDIYSFFLGKLSRIIKWKDEYVQDLYSQGRPDPRYESLEDIKHQIMQL